MILIKLTRSCAGVHALGKIKALSSLCKSKGNENKKETTSTNMNNSQRPMSVELYSVD